MAKDDNDRHREGTLPTDPFGEADQDQLLDARLITLDQARNPPAERFLVGRLYPMGKASVTYGPSGVGKSSLLSQLAFKVAAGGGGAFLSMLMHDQEGGPVLIYSAEDTFEDWQRKAGAALVGCPDIDLSRALGRLYVIDKTEGIARLSESLQLRIEVAGATTTRRELRATPERLALIACAKKLGARFINIETASRLVDDEDNPSMAALIAAAGHIAAETGAAVNVSHHPTKAASKENDSSPESARGGGAFIANARTAVSLFPADEFVLAQLSEKGLKLSKSDVVVLGHAKSTSSVPPQDPIVLVRVGTPHGAVLQLPELMRADPQWAAAQASKAAREEQSRQDRFARLYDVVEELMRGGPVSLRPLRDHADKVGVPARDMETFARSAIGAGILRVAREDKSGRILALGLGRRPERAAPCDPREKAVPKDETFGG